MKHTIDEIIDTLRGEVCSHYATIFKLEKEIIHNVSELNSYRQVIKEKKKDIKQLKKDKILLIKKEK